MIDIPRAELSRRIAAAGQTLIVIAAFALLLLATACAAATSIPSNTSTPAPTRVRVTAGQTIPLPVEPHAGPTEEYPTLTLHAIITDELRSTPVKARRVILGGKEIARDVSEFNVQLPGDIRDAPLMLQVEAEGYNPWSLVLRHRVSTVGTSIGKSR